LTCLKTESKLSALKKFYGHWLDMRFTDGSEDEWFMCRPNK
jgi:hypothetical protein